jgi:hypothetical protein
MHPIPPPGPKSRHGRGGGGPDIGLSEFYGTMSLNIFSAIPWQALVKLKRAKLTFEKRQPLLRLRFSMLFALGLCTLQPVEQTRKEGVSHGQTVGPLSIEPSSRYLRKRVGDIMARDKTRDLRLLKNSPDPPPHVASFLTLTMLSLPFVLAAQASIPHEALFGISCISAGKRWGERHNCPDFPYGTSSIPRPVECGRRAKLVLTFISSPRRCRTGESRI